MSMGRRNPYKGPFLIGTHIRRARENRTSFTYVTTMLCRTEADILQQRLKVCRPYFKRLKVFFEFLFNTRGCDRDVSVSARLKVTDLVHTTCFRVRTPRLGFEDESST